MNIAEAFQVLALPMDSSAEDVERRFRELARVSHPDTGGDDSRMKEVLAARALAADFVASRTVTVYRPRESDVTPLRDTGRDAADRAFASVIRFHVGRLRALQRFAALIGAVGLAAAAISSRLSPFANDLTPLLPAQAAGLAGLFGLFFLLLGLVLQLTISTLKQAIEDMQEALTDRTLFVDLFLELHVNVTAPITSDYLESSVRYWLGHSYRPPGMATKVRSLAAGWWLSPSAIFATSTPLRTLARRIGAHDFVRLILAKGVEVRLLERRERVLEGRLIAEYFVLLPASSTRGEQTEPR